MRRYVPYLALLRVGFAKPTGHPAAGALLPHRFTLTAGTGPAAVCSLWHCPAGHPDWPLASTLPCGGRTFLDPVAGTAAARPAPPKCPFCQPGARHPKAAPPLIRNQAHTGQEGSIDETRHVVVVFAVLFILYPLAELAAIIFVAKAVGVLTTLLLLLVFSLAGAWLAKREGLAAWRRFQFATAEGRVPTREVADGAMVLAAGALLLVPGFLTDVLGLLLLVPATRALARRLVPVLAARRRTRRSRITVSDGPHSSTTVRWGQPELEDRPEPRSTPRS